MSARLARRERRSTSMTCERLRARNERNAPEAPGGPISIPTLSSPERFCQEF